MTITPIPAAPVAARPAHRDPNVLRWLAAYTASMVGDNVYYLALSWAAVQAGTPAQAGLVTAVSAVPRALLMLGGGVVVDRFGPRRVVIGSDAVRCLAVLAVAALLFVTTPGLWPLALLGVVFGTVDAVFTPAVGALPARIAAPGQLARVQGMRGLGARFAAVAGAPLGGLGVALGGAASAFALAGLLIGVSVPLLLMLRLCPVPAADSGRCEAGEQDEDEGGERAGGQAAGPGRTAWRDLADGLRHIARHRVLAPLLTVTALGELGFTGPVNVGLVLLADRRGWGAAGVGWALAGFGTGAGLVSLALAVRGRLPHAGRTMAATLLASALAIGGLG